MQKVEKLLDHSTEPKLKNDIQKTQEAILTKHIGGSNGYNFDKIVEAEHQQHEDKLWTAIINRYESGVLDYLTGEAKEASKYNGRIQMIIQQQQIEARTLHGS